MCSVLTFSIVSLADLFLLFNLIVTTIEEATIRVNIVY